MSDSSQPAPLSKHRLLEARRLGYTPRSPELTAGVVLLAAAWVGQSALPQLVQGLQDLVSSGFRPLGTTTGRAFHEFTPLLLRVGQEVLRIWAACWAAAFVSDLAQVGFVWSPATLLPHEERISPASGLMRMFSWPTFERANLLSIKVLLGLALLGLLGDFALRSLTSAAERAEGDSLYQWQRGVSWTSLIMASGGTACLLSGILDAWIRQSRWRLSLEQTEDERRRRE